MPGNYFDERIAADGGRAPGQAGRRGDRRDRRRLRHHPGRGAVPARLPAPEHDHEPHHAGGAGRLLPERGRPPGAGRPLRDRGDVPALQRLPPGETIRPFTVTPAHLGFEEFEVANQLAISHHYWMLDSQFETFSVPFRYVWPSELDLMARLAGLTLEERWSDWARSPFTSDSAQHVSVWEKPG